MRSHVDTINMRTTHKLLEKFYRAHVCLVHASVKFKLSCIIHMYLETGREGYLQVRLL